MDDLTIIYYTSNREKPEFERRVQKTLLDAAGGTPIISVSQKPMDFGENICVGEVGVSSQNAYRQLLIGAEKAKTRYVCTAESDNLYPKEYFDYKPDNDDIAHIAQPLWLLVALRGKAKFFYVKPRGSESAMIINRELLIDRIKLMLKDCDYWGPYKANGDHFPYLLSLTGRDYFVMDTAVVTIKTDQNMHRTTPHLPESKTRELPFWGDSKELLGRYL
ncbi:MAG: hypothetical protein ACYTEQ_23785 [Planctomycetota bacterium]|jgi:hypothetical protein